MPFDLPSVMWLIMFSFPKPSRTVNFHWFKYESLHYIYPYTNALTFPIQVAKVLCDFSVTTSGSHTNGWRWTNWQITLRVLVDKEKNKVLLAEAGKDFVDALFCFLTLPVGTIARLVAEESNIEAVKFGSLSSLYQSVKDLDQQYLWLHTCKEMLLNPRNSMEPYCWKLKLNIDNNETLKHYFLCEDNSCKIGNRTCVSFIRNQKCICGKLLKKEKPMRYYLSREIGFVKETSTFIVSDDLCVRPNEVGTSLDLLQKLRVNNIDAVEKETLNISKKEACFVSFMSYFPYIIVVITIIIFFSH